MYTLGNLKITDKRSFYEIKYKNWNLAKIYKTGLYNFMTAILPDAANEVKKTVLNKTDFDVRVHNFSKKYNLEKQKFFGSGKLADTFTINELEHFQGAVKIIDEHQVSAHVYMVAQVEGLKFANGGKGTFPRITQIDTKGAEERLLQYLRNKQGGVDPLDLKVTEEDMKVPLKRNQRFMDCYEKIKNGTATLNQALYVRDCMRAKKVNVKEFVKDYIRDLRK